MEHPVLHRVVAHVEILDAETERAVVDDMDSEEVQDGVFVIEEGPFT